MWNGKPTLDDSYQRVRDTDQSRVDIERKTGRVFPDIDQMKIGEAREFDLAVLHIDVDNYTELMSRLTDSGKLRFMNSFLSEMGVTVRDYSGRVEKFVGDKVTAIFGIGESDELGTKHCLECALTMLTKIRYSINPYFQTINMPAFSCSVGMDFGTTWIARTGIHSLTQFSLVGNTVNIASQLEEMATSNQIFLGGNFYDNLSQEAQKNCRKMSVSNWSWSIGNIIILYIDMQHIGQDIIYHKII